MNLTEIKIYISIKTIPKQADYRKAISDTAFIFDQAFISKMFLFYISI